MSSSINIHTIDIDPTTAQTYLQTFNQGNRKMRQHRVKLYADQMKRGQWKEAGDPIRISKSHRLIDGQHRLQAIVESGVTLKNAVLITGLEDDVYQVIDSGLGRRNSDVLASLNIPNSVQAASAIRLYVAVMAGINPSDTSAMALVTRQDVAEFAEQHRDNVQCAVNIAQRVTRKAGGNASAWACLGIMSRLSKKTWLEPVNHSIMVSDGYLFDRFVELVESGVGLGVGHPALTLRNWIVNKNRYSGYEHLSAYIKAYRAYCNNDTLKVIRIWTSKSGAPFPTL